jgi:hypothetical protein
VADPIALSLALSLGRREPDLAPFSLGRRVGDEGNFASFVRSQSDLKWVLLISSVKNL